MTPPHQLSRRQERRLDRRGPAEARRFQPAAPVLRRHHVGPLATGDLEIRFIASAASQTAVDSTCESVNMSDPASPISICAALLAIWDGGDPAGLEHLITRDYIGHMLHVGPGERTGAMYGDWIAQYRENNPGVRFEVQDQLWHEDKVWSRLVARTPDGSVAHGMNVSRFVDNKIAEEWAVWGSWQAD